MWPELHFPPLNLYSVSPNDVLQEFYTTKLLEEFTVKELIEDE